MLATKSCSMFVHVSRTSTSTSASTSLSTSAGTRVSKSWSAVSIRQNKHFYDLGTIGGHVCLGFGAGGLTLTLTLTLCVCKRYIFCSIFQVHA